MNHLGRPQIEGGDPSVDLKAFRRALGSFPTGVTIITAPGREAPVGVTANSFSSVSLAPPLVLWSISNTSRSYKTFRESEHFAINVLADDQVHVSQNFASSRDDKFDSMAWRKGKTGSPLIDEVLAYFDCICEARHDCGDHTIIIGRVVDFARFEGAPLLFTQGRYGMAVDHIEVASRLSAPNSRRASLK